MSDRQQPGRGKPGPRHDRLLPWIAAERTIRAVVLIAAGIVLVTHPHTNWARTITRLANHLGLNTDGTGVQKVVDLVRRISSREDLVFGAIAIGYGILESIEAYGLWRRRRWGEWLTVVATALLLIPEAWELARSASPLKVGGLVLNLLVVAYLAWRLRRTTRTA